MWYHGFWLNVVIDKHMHKSRCFSTSSASMWPGANLVQEYHVFVAEESYAWMQALRYAKHLLARIPLPWKPVIKLFEFLITVTAIKNEITFVPVSRWKLWPLEFLGWIFFLHQYLSSFRTDSHTDGSIHSEKEMQWGLPFEKGHSNYPGDPLILRGNLKPGKGLRPSERDWSSSDTVAFCPLSRTQALKLPSSLSPQLWAIGFTLRFQLMAPPHDRFSLVFEIFGSETAVSFRTNSVSDESLWTAQLFKTIIIVGSNLSLG